MANPRGQQRDKPYRDALRMEIAAAGADLKLLREIAKVHLEAAANGDMAAIREMADRLDGKPAQEANITVEHKNAPEMSDDELASRIAELRRAGTANGNGEATDDTSQLH